MHAPETPKGITERPNLLVSTRCSSDAQQQILARLEVKAAEKARMMDMARKSLRVAGATAGGIGIAVALLVFAKHYNAPAKSVVPMVASAPLAPMPSLAPAAVAAAAEPSLAALLDAGATDPDPPPLPVVRIPASKPKAKKIVSARKAPVRPALRTLARRPAKAAAHPAAVAPVDTDAKLLSALLLHASRPAVVPPPFQRPACPGGAARPACGDPHYNEKQAKQ